MGSCGSHRRSRKRGHFTTVDAHMPESHRQFNDTKPLRRSLAQAGPAAAELVDRLAHQLKHPVACYRSLMGLTRLGQDYGLERLEAACRRALRIGSYSYRSVASILKHNLDQAPAPDPEAPAIEHANIRGATYYNQS